jgi:hypothetical protein
VRKVAAVGIVTVRAAVSHKTGQCFMNVCRLARLSPDEFFDIVVASIAGRDPLFIDHRAVVVTMAVAAGQPLIGLKLPEQLEIIIMKVFALFLNSRFRSRRRFRFFHEGMAGLAELLLVADDMGAILAAMLAVAEEAIALLNIAVLESTRYQRGVMAICQEAHLIDRGRFRIISGD